MLKASSELVILSILAGGAQVSVAESEPVSEPVASKHAHRPPSKHSLWIRAYCFMEGASGDAAGGR